MHIYAEGRYYHFRNGGVHVQSVDGDIGLQPDDVVRIVQGGAEGPGLVAVVDLLIGIFVAVPAGIVKELAQRDLHELTVQGFFIGGVVAGEQKADLVVRRIVILQLGIGSRAAVLQLREGGGTPFVKEIPIFPVQHRPLRGGEGDPQVNGIVVSHAVGESHGTAVFGNGFSQLHGALPVSGAVAEVAAYHRRHHHRRPHRAHQHRRKHGGRHGSAAPPAAGSLGGLFLPGRQGTGQVLPALLRQPDLVQFVPIAFIHHSSSLPAAAAAWPWPGPGGCSPGRDSGPAGRQSRVPRSPRSTAGKAPAGI